MPHIVEFLFKIAEYPFDLCALICHRQSCRDFGADFERTIFEGEIGKNWNGEQKCAEREEHRKRIRYLGIVEDRDKANDQ